MSVLKSGLHLTLFPIQSVAAILNCIQGCNGSLKEAKGKENYRYQRQTGKMQLPYIWGETLHLDISKVLESYLSCKQDWLGQNLHLPTVQDLQKLRERITEAGTHVNVPRDKCNPLQIDIHNLQKQYSQLMAELDDQENHQCCSNLRFVGLPEGAEGKSPESFLKDRIVNTFSCEKFSYMFEVEQAHGILSTPEPPVTSPRTFIVKLLNFQDRDAILCLRRDTGHLLNQNVKVFVYPDFSIAVQKEQAKFSKSLMSSNLWFIQPCFEWLTIMLPNSSKEDVFHWIDQHRLGRTA